MKSQVSIMRYQAILSIALCSLAVACGGSSKNEEAESPESATTSEVEDSLEGAPEWVMGDCRSFFKNQSVLCGVGAVSGVPSPSLARNTGMARGRTEIARFLEIEVKSVLTDYQAAKGGQIEQEIEDESKQITEMTLSGTRMAKYFIGKDGTYYALMVLELESFEESVSSADGIDAPLKQALVKHAKKTFSSRDDEVSRY